MLSYENVITGGKRVQTRGQSYEIFFFFFLSPLNDHRKIFNSIDFQLDRFYQSDNLWIEDINN